MESDVVKEAAGVPELKVKDLREVVAEKVAELVELMRAGGLPQAERVGGATALLQALDEKAQTAGEEAEYGQALDTLLGQIEFRVYGTRWPTADEIVGDIEYGEEDDEVPFDLLDDCDDLDDDVDCDDVDLADED